MGLFDSLSSYFKTDILKRAVNPERLSRGVRDVLKDPFSDKAKKFHGAQILGGGAQHLFKETLSKEKKAVYGREAEEIQASEQKRIDAEKAKSKNEQRDRLRKFRRTKAGRKGRRASIASGALGAEGEANVRRATLGAA